MNDDLFDEFAGYPSSPRSDVNIDTSWEDLLSADSIPMDYGIDLSSLGKDFGFDISNIDPNFGIGLPGDLSVWGLDVGLPGDYVADEELRTMFGNYMDTGSGMSIPGIEGFADVADEVGQGAVTRDPFEVDGAQSSRTEDTALTGAKDPFEVDGAQGSRTEDTALTGTTQKDPFEVDGEQGSRTEETATVGTKTDTTPSGGSKTGGTGKVIEDLFTGKGRSALLTALLGGLLGLLNKDRYPKGPVGYQGGIPRFRTVRGAPGQGYSLVRQAADGGLMSLAAGGRAARYLRGGTDGMADKIKTDIDGKQPARLSHGEFVIPADVVSHLGNGNSDAGADVLYDMMDKIRKARTGTTKQGKQINPRNFTPA